MILFNLLMSFFIDAIFTDEFNAYIGSIISRILSVVTQPITFGFGQAFTLYFQGAALLLVLIAIIFNGIKNGIWINGGTEDESVGHYIFRSMLPVGLIAGMPAFMGFVTTGANYLINDLLLASTGIDYGNFLKGIITVATDMPSQIFSIIAMIMIIYYTVTVLYQSIKRQLQLTVYSIIAPLIAIATVSQNNAGDFITLLKAMVGTGVVTAMQLSLLISAIALPGSSFFNETPALLKVFVIVSVFASIKQLPSWIERYTNAPSVSGSGGGAGRGVMMAGGMAARSAITKILK